MDGSLKEKVAQRPGPLPGFWMIKIATVHGDHLPSKKVGDNIVSTLTDFDFELIYRDHDTMMLAHRDATAISMAVLACEELGYRGVMLKEYRPNTCVIDRHRPLRKRLDEEISRWFRRRNQQYDYSYW